MAVLLALAAALSYGTADFAGGLATRRNPAVLVVALTQVVGLALVVLAAFAFPADAWASSDLVWGALAGLAGLTGLVLLYEALATGLMSVVSPVTAVVATVLPVVVGVAGGERPGTVAWVGIVLGAAATVLLGLAPAHQDVVIDPAVRRRAFLLALVSGAGFGTFFVLLDATSGTSGFVPLVAGRCTSVVVLGSWVLLRRLRPSVVDGRFAAAVLVAAAGDIGANVLFLLATRRGLLTIVSVCIALYPAATVLLARLLLRERLTAAQLGGLAVAAGAVVLVTV